MGNDKQGPRAGNTRPPRRTKLASKGRDMQIETDAGKFRKADNGKWYPVFRAPVVVRDIVVVKESPSEPIGFDGYSDEELLHELAKSDDATAYIEFRNWVEPDGC